jgi:hypothetical protein
VTFARSHSERRHLLAQRHATLRCNKHVAQVFVKRLDIYHKKVLPPGAAVQRRARRRFMDRCRRLSRRTA